ncbi:MAG: hypothetical protein M3Y64_09540 [Gemmatimonadota bacterium]|nr:hypothetical protein [Gemmatimonadota bacterium]
MIADEATAFGSTAPTARRTAWMAARARNAAKRGALIATVGLVAVAATVLVLIVVPREVDQAIRARIAALPPLADTIAFARLADTARARQKTADSTLRSLQYAAADSVAGASSSAANTRAGARTSDERQELGMRIARARSAPLVESFRAIGEADFLSDDVRVRALLDSLNEVNKQRDAYAALGGPDARYAALTARLASIGQQLTTIAEQRLANTSASTDTTTVSADSAVLAPRLSFNVDSMAQRVATIARDSANARVVNADQTLANARKSNAIALANRAQTEAQSTVNVPAVAMLLSALVLGLAIGYGVALALELRQPRIADVAEVERLTGARVIVHAGASRAATHARQRRQSDETLFPVIDTVSEAYMLLHVTLTGFGDTAHAVRVIGDTAMVSATVGINLAAAAAREARATLLIDADEEARLATSLLHIVAKKGVAESPAAPDALRSRIVRTKVGRDQYIDTLFAGRSREKAPPENTEQQNRLQQSLHDELQLLSNEHDLTVILAARDSTVSAALLPLASDAILCVRLGQTKNSWLINATHQLRGSNRRLRAVLLWAAATPAVR